MKLEIVNVFAVFTTIDEYGRNGELIMVTENRPRAETAAEGRGWWGGKGDIQLRKGIKVSGDEVYLLDIEHTSQLPLGIDLIKERKNKKVRALSKLTKEEKDLLGVEDEN